MTRAAAVLVLALVGCGTPAPAPGPSAVAVSGRVLAADGKPVQNVMLTLHPVDAVNQGQRPVVPVQAGGRFAASCPPGRYKATLVPLYRGAAPPGEGKTAGPADGPAHRTIPEQYQFYDTTPWEVTVGPEGSDGVEFKLPK